MLRRSFVLALAAALAGLRTRVAFRVRDGLPRVPAERPASAWRPADLPPAHPMCRCALLPAERGR